MKELNTSLIGKEGYPIDNSYSFKIGGGKVPYLAGTQCGEEPKKVKIISEPYKLTVAKGCIGEGNTYEFVTVRYMGSSYVVLNMFTF